MAKHVRSLDSAPHFAGSWQRRRPRAESPAATLAANATKNVVQILWGGRAFCLSQPVDLTVQRRGPYYFVGYKPLDIIGYGRDQRDALESFADVFSATWDSIASASDAELGGDARELKQKLRKLVAAVRPE